MVVFITSAIGIGIIFLYGCLGEIITEKAGHLNLGIPGIMSVGASGGCFGVWLYLKGTTSASDVNYLLAVLIAFFFAVLFAVITGLIYAFLTVSLRANQNVTGLTITTFGSGLTMFMKENVMKNSAAYYARASKQIAQGLPFADKLGWFGEIFLSHGIFVYLAIAIAIATAFVFKKSRVGLHLRAVGENPATADAVGIDVTKYKYLAICIGSAIAGLGGMYYILDYNNGSWEYGIEAFGWLSIALVIFALWKPNLSIFGSILFGCLYIAGTYMDINSFGTKQLLKLLPYVVTIIVLIITSIMDKKENQPPAALGLSYFREER